MKYTRLVDEVEKLASKHEQGSSIEPEKLGALQQLLTDKKSRYEDKLALTTDTEKHKKLVARLKVVTAQIEKAKQISFAD
ncbi:MAG: hypothetical protein GY784_07955 [Gammaproteobacteria bacterium]|nr:hypothetical protein [Gammaproteobacteria bacterium]